MVATADLWVYNAENFCVSFFNQVTSIFHLRGGKIRKSFFWAYLFPIVQFQGKIKHVSCCAFCKRLQSSVEADILIAMILYFFSSGPNGIESNFTLYSLSCISKKTATRLIQTRKDLFKKRIQDLGLNNK